MRVDAPPFDMTPEKLIEGLLDPNSDPVQAGRWANDILPHFRRGFSFENLRLLLISPHDEVQAHGAFISTFFFEELEPLLPDLVALLSSPVTRTRFDAIEALQQCTTTKDGDALGRVLLCLDDEWHGVRWKTVGFISTAARWQLQLAVKHAALLRQESAFTVIRDLFQMDMGRGTIQLLIESDDPILRRFGAGMAVRPRYVLLLEHVDMLTQSADPDLVTIAESARDGILGSANASLAARVDFVPRTKVAKRR
jgi:hypothetical protein